MEKNFFGTQDSFINKNKISLIALVLVTVVFFITVLTAFISTPTFLNRLATAIITWQLPLIIVGLLVFASVFEKEKKASLFRLIATGLLVLSFFFTNTTKNMVQDTVSNAGNFVDVAAATIEKEFDNVDEYEAKIEDTIDDITRKMMRKNRDRYDEEYDW